MTHTFGELGVATAAVLQLHAAHPNFILDNQTYYWNLEDDVIAGGLLPFDGPFLQVPQDGNRRRARSRPRGALCRLLRARGRGPSSAGLEIRTTPATTSCVLAREERSYAHGHDRSIEPCWCTVYHVPLARG